MIWIEYQDKNGVTPIGWTVPMHGITTVRGALKRLLYMVPAPDGAVSYQLTLGLEGRVLHYGDDMARIGACNREKRVSRFEL